MAQYLFTFFFYDFTFKIFIILFINKIFETIIFLGFTECFGIDWMKKIVPLKYG